MDPCQQGQVGRGAHESHHAGFGWDGVVAKRWAEGQGLYTASLTCSPEGLWLHVFFQQLSGIHLFTSMPTMVPSLPYTWTGTNAPSPMLSSHISSHSSILYWHSLA